MNVVWICLAGFLAGTAGALGLGGGGFLLLYLTLVAGMEQFKAQGVNLLFFLPCAVLALIIHMKNHLIVWKAVWPAALTGLLGAVGGWWLGGMLGKQMVGRIFACCLLLLGAIECWNGGKAAIQYFKERKAARRHTG